MEQLGDVRGLVIHAGEGLWPQLDALAQWADHLTDLRLVIAAGDDEPNGPAERLERFVATYVPHLRVERVGVVYDDDPTQTAAAIAAATANGGPWLVDVSGGTRLMFAGGVIAATRLPDVRVVFRDADGPWYQIDHRGVARPLEGLWARAIERFTVKGLLDVTWADTERHVRIVNPSIEPEVVQAAEVSLQRPDRWRREFERACRVEQKRLGRQASAGRVFERYVLSLLRQMGVADDDSAIGVMLLDGDQSVQEVDVVVNSNGWLHVIDCKLSDVDHEARGSRVKAPPLGTQIREAFTTRRLLGDGGDQFILLRPNRTFAEEFRSLCFEYGVTVVDRTVLAKTPLPTVLRRLIRPPEPDPPD